ncbi:phosphotransferase family protein [Intrasporangium sp.]|uniref:phosphotransferase family protein n=1 Tax=Intrasporangium sp. TaxID=1925024 RepID=UPI0032217FD4
MSTSTDDLVRIDRLGPALVAATGSPAWARPRAELIAGGKSNLTYRLSSPAGTLIMRRPPSGELLPRAHDMSREARIQQALAATAVPVPAVVLSEPTGHVIGAPFYVMQDVTGHIIRDTIPEGYATSRAERERLAAALIDTLADIHAVDVDAARIADFGNPDGFLARQVTRWQRQWERSKDADVPAVEELSRRLARQVPATARHSLVHGDYRLDNVVLDPDHPGRVRAVLDWEMATLGDPLTDLGLLLLYWTEPHDPPPLLTPHITATAGFPGRDFVRERYAARTGLDLSDIAFYEGLARFKLAVIAQGIARRVASGAMAGQDFGDLATETERLATAGLTILSAHN